MNRFRGLEPPPLFRALALGFLFFFCLLPAAGAGQPAAAMQEVVVTNSSRHLLLYGKVAHGFTPEMEKALQNGISVTFTFFLNVERVRASWLDQGLVSRTFEHTLTYDTLKEQYVIAFSEKNGKTVATESLREARALMTEINGLEVLPLDRLEPGEEYVLKVKARLAEKTLPLYFHYLIPFWELWDFETDWHTVAFRY